MLLDIVAVYCVSCERGCFAMCTYDFWPLSSFYFLWGYFEPDWSIWQSLQDILYVKQSEGLSEQRMPQMGESSRYLYSIYCFYYPRYLYINYAFKRDPFLISSICVGWIAGHFDLQTLNQSILPSCEKPLSFSLLHRN